MWQQCRVMDVGESSSKNANYTSGITGDTNLSKKFFDKISKITVCLVEIDKNQEIKFKSWTKAAGDERSLGSTGTLYKEGLCDHL